MSFFLVARTDEGTLVLLSERSFGSARAAQAHLSELSSDSAFPHFDDEVLVMDLDKGTPVLLVRPAGARTAATETAEEETVVVVEEEAEEAEPEIEEEAAEAEAEEAEPVVEEVSDEAIADEIAEEALADEEGVTLKDALSRTAASMEAEGITPPESVGPAEEAEEPSEETEAAADEPAEAEESAETEESAESAEPTDEPVEDAGESAAWPWDASKESGQGEPLVDLDEEKSSGMADELIIIDEGTSGSTEGGEIVTVPAAEAEEEAAVEEPAAPEAVFELDDLEAPAVEASPLVSSGADDEMLALSRPVILDADALDQAFDNAVAEPMGSDVPEGSGPDDISAFIRDLEQVTEIPEAAAVVEEAPEPEPEPAPSKGAMLPGVTCDDCVYEPTCPNKENRTPQQCGSFQWKTV